MIELYKSEHLEVGYDPSTRILHCHWKGLQSADSIRSAGEIIKELFITQGADKILNDSTHVIGDWYHSIQYAREWFAIMFEAGLQYFAWLVSANIFVELSARKAMPPGSERVKLFRSFEDAHSWLLSSNEREH